MGAGPHSRSAGRRAARGRAQRPGHFVQHQAAKALERITGQKLGYDTAKWQAWWSANKSSFGRPRLGTAGFVSLGVLALAIIAGLLAWRRFQAAHVGGEPHPV